jgi:hypothetical protein
VILSSKPRLEQEVIALIPEYLDKPYVLGIGEVGLNKSTRTETALFRHEGRFASASDDIMNLRWVLSGGAPGTGGPPRRRWPLS